MKFIHKIFTFFAIIFLSQLLMSNIATATTFEETDLSSNLDSIKSIDDSMKTLKSNIDTVENKFTDTIPNENFIDILRNLEIADNLSSETSKIYISDEARELMLRFINGHSSYTYSINENGYLTCNHILKENLNLDYSEPEETEMDIGLNNAFNYGKDIIISLNNSYYLMSDSSIVSTSFDDTLYLKSYETENSRLIIFNNYFYNENNNIDFNLDLSDTFIKSLTNVQYNIVNNNGVQLMSNSFIPISANSVGHQPVYGGPSSNGTYTTIGSVDDGELLIVIGKEDGYYHIEYIITGQSTKKSGYVPQSAVSGSGLLTSVKEEIMDGKYGYSLNSNSIRSCYSPSSSISIGSISKNEGITILYQASDSDSYFIEYSTSTGAKRGYIEMSKINSSFNSFLIKSPSRVITFTGPDYSKFDVGTGAIGVREYVCALGYTNNGYIFIEYNTTSGRKRAFCEAVDFNLSNLSDLGIPELPDLQITSGYISNSKQNVAGGPGIPSTSGATGAIYSYVGAIGEKESVYRQSETNSIYNQFGYTYIVYHVNSSYKGGYVLASTLTKGRNPSIPDCPSSVLQDGGFELAYTWQTGLGAPINSYKIGTGSDHLYLIFAQHGFEDEGYGDGIELVNLAYDFMEMFYSQINTEQTQNILNDWTIYIVPYVNRDGIVSGHTENGPGRCTIVKEIDMNRNWPTTSYQTVLSKGRNYTGPNQLDTVEAKGLKEMLFKEDVAPIEGSKSILLDIHGWDCETIGDTTIGNYYTEQFKNDSETSFINHSQSHSFRSRELGSAPGYLVKWALENSFTSSIILELPSHTNRVEGSRTISQRFYTATINLLENQ